MTTIDTLLAQHCSAVLLRKKPAALFRAPRDILRGPAMEAALRHHRLAHTILCDRCERHVLVLIFHPALLSAALSGPDTCAALAGLGYPVSGLAARLSHLRVRILSADDGFPHEIGFFLGYPAEDVLGFMRHKGKHCKHCGLWKVYSDVDRAKAMFAEYQACQAQVLAHLERGGSVLSLPTRAAG